MASVLSVSAKRRCRRKPADLAVMLGLVGSFGGCGSPRSTAASDADTGATSLGASTGVETSGSGGGEVSAATVADDAGDTRLDVGAGTTGGFEVDPIPPTCEDASAGTSSVGCLFFAVDLDAYDDFETLPYAVTVANPQLDAAAEVTVEEKIGGAWTVVAGPESIASMALHTFTFDDLSNDDTGLLEGGARRIRADVPVSVYQFNPIDGASHVISDASMLHPVETWDTRAHQVGAPSSIERLGQGGTVLVPHGTYFTVVAAHDGTEVEITPSAPALPGGGVTPAVGVPFTVTLDEGDIFELMNRNEGESLSGTTIVADQPIGLFSGHECAWVPIDNGTCDHLEEQLAGLHLWGKHLVAARLPARKADDPEPMVWQIQATRDGTSVEISAHAEVTGLPAGPVSLDAGETLELTASGTPQQQGDFEVVASEPIAVVGYMIGTNALGLESRPGDPAMVQMSPVEQFLPRYVVLVPDAWETDHLVLTRPAGATITVDGVPVPNTAFVPVGDGDLEVARWPVEDGVHVLDGGEERFGVVVTGVDRVDSYAYLGGTGTRTINPNPG